MEDKWLISPSLLTGIADAIRAKEDSTEAIQVSELASRIGAISTGVEVRTASGTFKTSNKGVATVTCGFQPDVVSITLNETYDGEADAVAIPFLEYSGKKITVAMWTTSSSGYLYDFSVSSTTTGFSVTSVTIWDGDWNESTVKNKSFSYTAYKFT